MARFLLLTLLVSFTLTASVHAEPTAPALFCAANPKIPECTGKVVDCTYCHTSVTPPMVAWNPYGLALREGTQGKVFGMSLGPAAQAVSARDSDGDGVDNATELLAGTQPGNPASKPQGSASGANAAAVGAYDFNRAFRRLYVLYCGRSASFEERSAFTALAADPAAQRARIDAALDGCLQSDYWRNEGLHRLADVRIRPIKPVGRDGTARLIIIGDYEWDYRLWSYILSDDRDMRDLLLANYHVESSSDGKLVKREGVIPEPEWAPVEVPNLVNDLVAELRGSPQGQPLPPEQRAGMITTSWFIAVNTMFSPLPRTTAAQAFRAYLGQDIALGQGIQPVAGEPADIDKRNVGSPGCVDCHSTLDPMAYAFVWYNGISGRGTGSYSTSRPTTIPGWTNNRGSLLGQPMTNARDFAKIAVASDLFPRNLANIFLKHAIEREVTTAEAADFEQLWRSIASDGWSANKLIHRIVKSSFFGGGK